MAREAEIVTARKIGKSSSATLDAGAINLLKGRRKAAWDWLYHRPFPIFPKKINSLNSVSVSLAGLAAKVVVELAPRIPVTPKKSKQIMK